MKEKYLILLDLDGTALYDWQTLSQETIDAIEMVKEQGHLVTIATGRPFRSSKIFYDQLKLTTPIINYNGALVHHPHDEQFDEVSNEIDLNHVLKVFNEIDFLIENAFCEYYEDIYIYKESEDIMPLVHPEGGRLIFGPFHETLRLNPNGFIILTYPNRHKEVEDYLRTHFKGILNFRNWGNEYQQIIEIYNPSTCKGYAMNLIANYYDIPNEKIIAFGDGENDVEMIKNAGIGVAMGNAVENVKNVAKYVTLPNTEHGVAHFLNNYFNNKNTSQS